MPEKPKINCLKCHYYYVTWDKNFPKGCTVFRFKSKKLPSEFVCEASGLLCEHFVEKPEKTAEKRPKKT